MSLYARLCSGEHKCTVFTQFYRYLKTVMYPLKNILIRTSVYLIHTQDGNQGFQYPLKGLILLSDPALGTNGNYEAKT